MRFIAHPAIYVALYLVLMLPTYFLPYLGSNSAVLNTAGLASGVGMHPLFWVHLLFLGAIVALAWVRGTRTGRRWIIVFPVLAAVFDLTPGLSFIPLVPTVMHLLAIILGVMGSVINVQEPMSNKPVDAQRRPAPAILSDLKVGDRVVHLSLGEGIVDSIVDDGTMEVMVAFVSPQRTYSMNTAYLRRLDA